MANQAPHSPVYNQTVVITDPEDPKAVQIPDGANDGSDPGPHRLTTETPNESFGDEVAEDASEPKISASPDSPPAARPSDADDSE